MPPRFAAAGGLAHGKADCAEVRHERCVMHVYCVQREAVDRIEGDNFRTRRRQLAPHSSVLLSGQGKVRGVEIAQLTPALGLLPTGDCGIADHHPAQLADHTVTAEVYCHRPSSIPISSATRALL